MTVATFTQPDFTTQDAATYKAAIDAAVAVLAEVGRAFACHQADPSTPDMTVVVDPGRVFAGGELSSVAAQTSSTFVAPVTNPRVDRVVIDETTGAAEVVAGDEAASPTAPAIPGGKLPCCQIALTVGMTKITDADITDERTQVPAQQPAAALFMWQNYGGL